MDFKTFQSNCKYAQYGLKQDTVREFELTCRKPECIQNGCSWGKCDELHCPHFGIEIDSGVMIDEKTGKTLISFTGGKFIFSE